MGRDSAASKGLALSGLPVIGLEFYKSHTPGCILWHLFWRKAGKHELATLQRKLGSFSSATKQPMYCTIKYKQKSVAGRGEGRGGQKFWSRTVWELGATIRVYEKTNTVAVGEVSIILRCCALDRSQSEPGNGASTSKQ